MTRAISSPARAYFPLLVLLPTLRQAGGGEGVGASCGARRRRGRIVLCWLRSRRFPRRAKVWVLSGLTRRFDPRHWFAEHRLQAASTSASAAVIRPVGRRRVAEADQRAAANRRHHYMHPEEKPRLAPVKVEPEAWRSASPTRFCPALQRPRFCRRLLLII